MIEVSDLAKSFGAVKAVDGASFTAPDGAITTLLGANGSGKTTTLSMIMGLLKPDRGLASVDGGLVDSDPIEARRRLGWFPDAASIRASPGANISAISASSTGSKATRSSRRSTAL